VVLMETGGLRLVTASAFDHLAWQQSRRSFLADGSAEHRDSYPRQG
jgi:hypothetical protein